MSNNKANIVKNIDSEANNGQQKFLFIRLAWTYSIFSIVFSLIFANFSYANTVGSLMLGVKPTWIQDSQGKKHQGYFSYYRQDNKLIEGGFLGSGTGVVGKKENGKFVSKAMITKGSFVLDSAHVDEGSRITGSSVIQGLSKIKGNVLIEDSIILSSLINNNASVTRSYIAKSKIKDDAQIIGSRVDDSLVSGKSHIYNSQIIEKSSIVIKATIRDATVSNAYLFTGVLIETDEVNPQPVTIPTVKFVNLDRHKTSKKGALLSIFW